jgi:hypothetical protein
LLLKFSLERVARQTNKILRDPGERRQLRPWIYLTPFSERCDSVI